MLRVWRKLSLTRLKFRIDRSGKLSHPFFVRKILLASGSLTVAMLAGLVGQLPVNPQPVTAQPAVTVATNSPASAAASQSGNSVFAISANTLGDYTADHVACDESASYHRAGDMTPANIQRPDCHRGNKLDKERCRPAGA